VDAAQHAVKAAKVSLYPTITLKAAPSARDLAPGSFDQFTGTVLGRWRFDLPGWPRKYSVIRQTKETLGQRRIELDVQPRSGAREGVQGWSQLEATKAQSLPPRHKSPRTGKWRSPACVRRPVWPRTTSTAERPARNW